MKVLITGSNGCVGSALKSICQTDDNNEWIFLDRSHCDLTRREATIETFKRIKPNYIIHLASYVPGFYNIDNVRSFADNVKINDNVLEASHLVGIENGMFGLSVNMFPEAPSKFPMDETMVMEGELSGVFAGYAYSKRMLYLQYHHYNNQYGRKYFGIVPCNIYGMNDNLTSGRLIPSLISKFQEAINNNSDVLLNGSGKPLRQFIYSIDLAKIIKRLSTINYQETKPIICCGNEEVSILELAHEIGQIMEFKKNIIFDASKPDGNLKKTVSNQYLKTIMPDIQFTALHQGLTEIINSMEKSK